MITQYHVDLIGLDGLRREISARTYEMKHKRQYYDLRIRSPNTNPINKVEPIRTGICGTEDAAALNMLLASSTVGPALRPGLVAEPTGVGWCVVVHNNILIFNLF